MYGKTLFNDKWEFTKQKIGTAFEEINNPPVKWIPVDIPHDWLIYDTHNLYEDSEGWYRKNFSVNESDISGKIILRFEGVYMDSSVFINGRKAGEWKYGYSTFEIDITGYLSKGENSVIVKAVFQHPNSRWYSGAGIYRNVWIKKVPCTHIVSDGIYISTRKEKKEKNEWSVLIDSELYSGETSGETFSLRHTLTGPNGETAGSVSSEPDFDAQLIKNSQVINVQNPLLWDRDSPHLYTIKSELEKDGKTIHSETNSFGFRTIRFNPDKGFFLNDRHMKLNGVCQHHDLGCLGAAVNRAATRRQLVILKDMGVNAVRTAHNMPSVEFMELADEMGILVCSEAFDMWESPKTEYDYARFFKDWHEKDIASWVRRDRNHPSVIMWSIGNEVGDTHHSSRGLELTKKLADLVQTHDYRKNAYVTFGSNYMPWENTQKCADIIKLAGYNYAEKYYEKHHRKYPDWIIFGSETASIVQSRGIYHFPASVPILADDDEQCSSLGNSCTSWGAKRIEDCVIYERDADFSAGQFLWSGFDYLGEPTPYNTKNSYFGQIDTCGFPKDAFFFYQAAWTDYKKKPMVHILPYWDFNEGQLIDIIVYSNAPSIELFFNDKSLGKTEINYSEGDKFTGRWQIPYKPGTLKAYAYDENGKIIAEDMRKSFSDAFRLIMKPDKTEMNADGRDLVFIEISAEDSDGNPVENTNNMVKISVRREGRLIGLDNGDSTDYDQFKGSCRKLFSGKMLAVIASKTECGEIEISAESPGLEPASVIINSLECEVQECISALTKNSAGASDESDERIPVRKILLKSSDGSRINKNRKQIRVEAEILPRNASYSDLEWRITNESGIDSPIANVSAEDKSAIVSATGDGKFTLRCMTRNGSDKIRLISRLEFEATGLGTAYLNPYKFISAGLFTDSRGEIGSGNEQGVATPRDEPVFIGFKNIDFGSFGSDEITIPIFVLDNDEFRFQILEGLPEEKDSTVLADAVYHKKSIWNTYQEESYKLTKRLKGITTISFVTERKAHIKGFVFSKPGKAFHRLYAAENDKIYGDSFSIRADAIEKIGNNVTLEFADMDFGGKGSSGIIICGRAHNGSNPVRIRFRNSGNPDDCISIIEFPESKDYIEKQFSIKGITGQGTVDFIFMPGSNFDFKWFRFLQDQ